MQGVWVQSLVGELRFYILYAEQPKKFFNYYMRYSVIK